MLDNTHKNLFPPCMPTPANSPSTAIFVTQPHLPPLEEFRPYLEAIWENKLLTNNGPFHQQLEAALCDYFGVQHLSLFANGTLALLTALQALRISGEVITTPYSFVATSHALMWNNLKPVFVDIDPVTMNLDPDRIEAAITPQTTAILPVHCYGTPCNTLRIQEIADTHGLKVIYDAAHAFGVKQGTKSLLRHGDLSVISFHATKVFNTFEGGAIICHDAKTKKRIDQLKNFGFTNETTVTTPGINAKMSEINAAFGLLQLKHVDRALLRRQQLADRYRDLLTGCLGLTLPPRAQGFTPNNGYFPILIGNDYPLKRDALYLRLKEDSIHSRRYFYPLISEFPIYRGLTSSNRQNLPVATRISREVLCLPLYPDLSDIEQDKIIHIVRTPITPKVSS